MTAPPAHRFSRRSLLRAGLATATVSAGGLLAQWAYAQSRRAVSRHLDVLVWDDAGTSTGRMRTVVLVPRHHRPEERFPVLIALHGLGETLRGVERGAWGWERDYNLSTTEAALRHRPLERMAVQDLIAPARLTLLRNELRRRAYGGMVVLMPFTPDVLSDLGGTVHQAFDRWLVETLLPRARRELPVLATREATGIDGVSLGGLHALWTGFGHPETFGVVGALQPAVRNRQLPVADRFVRAPTRPTQRVRIVTSDRDSLRPDVLQLDEVLRTRGIAHEFRELVGPHDYIFNRGPGGAEMLLFHDRALRGEPCP